MAAMLMAIYFRGLDNAETAALTLAMRDSGDVLKFPKNPRPLVDKHSTGGIGDKVSLPLVPLLACLGFRVPMISGRGLGLTGGTLDKLDSIPGFKTLLSAGDIVEQVQKIGCVLCGQTAQMVPADQKIYALRDASGTVPSIPLIVSSILSKKLAESLDALILDVKFGCAAFMQTKTEARTLARAKDRPGDRIELELRDAFDHKSVGHRLKGRRRNGVAEDILRPSHRCSRRHRHIIRNEAKLVALARTQHQTVRTETDWRPVAVGCLVMEPESDQRSSDQRELHD